ncbi:Pyoverdin chromophore biosynthetic protein pvcC [Nocardia terpenica]|uniref:Pyoverdin chromophore biosynthetic protein pvcC n=2 Tax=Nocardia terpenica TaxID=455432 RepID=A0A6G9ZFD8_9NOCA|nr:4-hydroxyphenylacetate 3-hydroxylase N-terminal domain-containing protein [Nocardia terpenica]QIS24339.1 Pyoverdin chromophore biosynthetic protein pvcC [Nocardia terpenica]
MTGKEYLDSLRDDRQVYFRGERVGDVTTHPAFRNSARSIARLYDALHDPEAKGLRVPTDTGNGGFTHPFFRTPRSSADLLAARDAIVEWQRLGFGWVGRTPDYKASLLGTLSANAEFYGEFADNARYWYKHAQERLLYFNHATVHPPIDRHKPADEIADVCVHVERETDAGLVVSGAKVVATNSALTNANFVAHYGVPVKDQRFGLVFTVPMNTPGITLSCRSSYELTAAVMGSPFDYPLSSRFDENDAIMYFDKVLVPWENVFLYDAEAASMWAANSGFLERFSLHGCTRLAVKLDFIAGAALKAIELTGASQFRGVQAQIGELLSYSGLFWGLSNSMVHTPTEWVAGSVQPNVYSALAYRTAMGDAYPRIMGILQKVLGSALIYRTSHASDWANPELRPLLDRYLRGSDGTPSIERVKLMNLLWDAIGTEFAGRHELYELNYAGDYETVRMQTLLMYQQSGAAARLQDFAQQCMNDYDSHGWTRPDLINPDDITIQWTERR